ncbi:LAQU0S12e01882g1_1 [Lachancea quebecensis]|uniref:LAQU0S12e01882g1_1 n=1 Tax=Lachancea quebecensis TaxID=1654605 RepID=A0A0N7MM20_9SACH|nr:LAQU0S12e01882g1_1 [Lachancea quebecensis]
MSSIEIIEEKDHPAFEGHRQPLNVDIIEITSGNEDLTPAKAATRYTYPSSPRVCHKSSPLRATVYNSEPLDHSVELSAAFNDDIAIGETVSESSFAFLEGQQNVAMNKSKESSPASLIPLNKSSPTSTCILKKHESALDQIISEDVLSSDAIENTSKLASGRQPPLSFKAMGHKWSLANEENIHFAECEQNKAEEVAKVTSARNLFVKSSQSETSIIPPQDVEEQSSFRGVQTHHDTKARRIPSDINMPASKHCQTNDAIEYSSTPEASKSNDTGQNTMLPSKINAKISLSYSSKRLREETSEALLSNAGSEDTKRMRKFIVLGKSFTDEESRLEINKSLATSAGKKEFNAVNKLVKEPSVLKEEISIDICASLYQSFLEEGVDLKERLSPAQVLHTHTVNPLMKLRRNCKSIYDYEHGIFYPARETLVTETISILYYEALEFFHQYATDKVRLEKFLEECKMGDQLVLIMLSGCDNLIKGLQNLENRRFRQQINEELRGASPRRKRTSNKNSSKLEELNIKPADVEKKIESIAVSMKVHFFSTETKQDFAIWMNNLLVVVGRKRYDPIIRHQNWSHISLRSAQDPQDALSKTVEQLDQMTRLKAQRVVAIYKSFQQLYEDVTNGYLFSGDDGNTLMGSAAEKAMATLLTSENPEELIYLD